MNDDPLKLYESAKKNLQKEKQSFYCKINSDSVKNIIEALCSAQAEFPIINFNKQNPAYRSNYADLSEIIKGIRPILAKYGLALTQQTVIADNTHLPPETTILITRLTHKSGEFLESHFPIIPDKPIVDPTKRWSAKSQQQLYGAALTYARRYQIVSLLNVVIAEEDDSDDNGNTETQPTLKNGARLIAIRKALNNHPHVKQQILDFFKIESIDDLPEKHIDSVLKKLQKLKEGV